MIFMLIINMFVIVCVCVCYSYTAFLNFASIFADVRVLYNPRCKIIDKQLFVHRNILNCV